MNQLKPIKIFIVAGEASGDVLAANLIDALKELSFFKFEISGVGGDRMINSGVNLIFHLEKIAVMGLFEVVKHLFSIIHYIKKTNDFISNFNPDILICVDAQEFSKQILKKTKNPNCIKIQYVAPSVWAWRPKRAKKLHKYVDFLLTLFKFEKKYFSNSNMKVIHVGHPLIEDEDLIKSSAEYFKKKIAKQIDAKIITVLPGSRISEVVNILPKIATTMNSLVGVLDYEIYIPCASNVLENVKQCLNLFKKTPILITDSIDKYSLFKASDLAIAASGTVTLELGLCATPSIVVYHINTISAFLAKFLISSKYFSLVNILTNNEVHKELIQQDFMPEKLRIEILKIINNLENEKDRVRCLPETIAENLTPETGGSTSKFVASLLLEVLQGKNQS